jgi:hypothetical protein
MLFAKPLKELQKIIQKLKHTVMKIESFVFSFNFVLITVFI